jgi:heat shock protein HtpX
LWRGLVVALLISGLWLVIFAVAGLGLYLFLQSIDPVNGPSFWGWTALTLTGAVVLTLRPRRNRFAAPGPRLYRSEEPELFALIDEVARETRLPTPDEVYINGDVNAGVFNRGGFFGFRVRRGLVLGLPLMRLMSVQQFKAVLAHEYAHYYGGDTIVGGWMARIERRLARMVDELAEGHVVAAIPVAAYADLVFSVSNRINRREEFLADERAARAYGGGVLAGFLRDSPGWRMAFAEYIHRRTAAQDTRRGVVTEFPSFLESPDIQKLMRFGLFREMEVRTARGTHPSLRDRLARVRAIGDPEIIDGRAASQIIRSFDELELRLFVHWARHLPAG